MSVVAASDFLTDEELEDLGEDGISVVTYTSDTDKQPRKKKTSSKPPPSPRSPYLSSTNLHPKKAAVWRSLKGTGMMHNENPAARAPREFWLASLKSSLALSQPMKADYDVTSARMSTSTSTPEYLKEAFGMKKPKHSRTSSNGYIPGTPDFKEKEDMYDEILDLKKCLQAQKSESDLMKTKLRRLEEDNSKKEKQIEQLLNPTKGSEYTRAFVDKRNDGSVVTNGLKQKILKLEQQCKEKDSALTKLQSDLKTTNMEEMKIALETYFEEIQRLKVLLASAETAERSNRGERKESLKQQKALNSSILRLSKNTKQLQEENKSLREELERATETPSSTARGYSEWSKQRLVRRITELEKKADHSGRAQSTKETDLASGPRATHVNTVLPTADPAVQGVTATPSANDVQECARLRGLLKKLREERAELQESLADRNAEVKLLSTEKADADKEVQRLKTFEQEASRHKEEIEKLTGRIISLEKELVEERHLRAELEQNYQDLKVASSGRAASQFQDSLAQTPESSASTSLSLQCRHRMESEDRAAKTIQRHWHQYKSREPMNKVQTGPSGLGSIAPRSMEHRKVFVSETIVYFTKNESDAEYSAEDLVTIQSAIRGHLNRQKQLAYIKDHCQNRLQKSTESCGAQGDQDYDTVTLLQATLRGHLARCRFINTSVSSGPGSQIPAARIESSVPTPAPRRLLSANQSYQSSTPGVSNANRSDEEIEEDIPDVTEMDSDKNCNSMDSKQHSAIRQKAAPAPLDLHQPTDTEATKAGDSDDSDDIIVSPARPVRRKDSYF